MGRVFLIEDGESLGGRFLPLDRVQLEFDTPRTIGSGAAAWSIGDYHPLDESADDDGSLVGIGISVADVRAVAGSMFPEFDAIEVWTPVSTEVRPLPNHLAFGPIQECAILVRHDDGDLVEAIDVGLQMEDDAHFEAVVELFRGLAGRWELLFENCPPDVQFVVGDQSMLRLYLRELVDFLNDLFAE